MTHIPGSDRSQLLLLPEAIDDYVAADNPVRFIDAFVDALDLTAAGFARVEAKATGRPGYAPGDLLKLYIYGYLNRIQSSRRLERETQRNIELMWLTGRLAPDFKTIADFRRDNGPAIRAACARFLVFCRQFNLFTRAVVAIDGSKFKAVNNRDKNFTVAKVAKRIEQVEASIARYLTALDHADRQDSDIAEAKATRLKEKIEGLRRQMLSLKEMERQVEAAPDKQVSLTDPDARSMATSGKGTGIVGYNVQIAVDAEHHLIVAHEVIYLFGHGVGGRPGERHARMGKGLALLRCAPPPSGMLRATIRRRRRSGESRFWRRRGRRTGNSRFLIELLATEPEPVREAPRGQEADDAATDPEHRGPKATAEHPKRYVAFLHGETTLRCPRKGRRAVDRPSRDLLRHGRCAAARPART